MSTNRCQFISMIHFMPSNRILTHHASRHCSLFSNLHIFSCNRYCCQVFSSATGRPLVPWTDTVQYGCRHCQALSVSVILKGTGFDGFLFLNVWKIKWDYCNYNNFFKLVNL